jgi:hypothetical protein
MVKSAEEASAAATNVMFTSADHKFIAENHMLFSTSSQFEAALNQ